MDKKENILDGDGASEEFFNLLWTKDELNFGPSINIPDTIIFKYGQPIAWYFTSSNGKIKKKNRSNLMLTRMEHDFTKYALGYDVIATFMSAENDPSKEGSLIHSTVEFLDRKIFSDFLYNRSKSCSGILQRFIEPKSTKNETVRAIWSPKVCLLERVENIHQLHDQRYGLYERCITYEGPEYYSVSAPIRGPVLAGQIQKICESVVSHISEVTFGQISLCRIVLNFKVDSRDKIWLLFTTSIRSTGSSLDRDSTKSLHDRSLVNISSAITLPNTVHLSSLPSYDKSNKRETYVRCVSCSNETIESLRHPITYKTVIRHFDHVLHLVKQLQTDSDSLASSTMQWPPDPEILSAAGGVGFGCLDLLQEGDAPRPENNHDSQEADKIKIPPIIRYLHPKLTFTSYSRCRNDPLFHYKTVNVCEPCYLVYAEFSTLLLRLDGDLTKLLGSDQPQLSASLASGGGGGMSVTSSLSGTQRPSSAEWRAMSAVHRTRSEPSLHSRHDGGESSQLRRPPTIPAPIRSVNKKMSRTISPIRSDGGETIRPRNKMSPSDQ